MGELQQKHGSIEFFYQILKSDLQIYFAFSQAPFQGKRRK